MTLGLASVVVLINPKFQGPQYRAFRLSTFIATALSGLLPLAHGIQMFGFVQMLGQSGMGYYVIEGLVLMLGAMIYMVSITLLSFTQNLLSFHCLHFI